MKKIILSALVAATALAGAAQATTSVNTLSDRDVSSKFTRGKVKFDGRYQQSYRPTSVVIDNKVVAFRGTPVFSDMWMNKYRFENFVKTLSRTVYKLGYNKGKNSKVAIDQNNPPVHFISTQKKWSFGWSLYQSKPVGVNVDGEDIIFVPNYVNEKFIMSVHSGEGGVKEQRQVFDKLFKDVYVEGWKAGVKARK